MWSLVPRSRQSAAWRWAMERAAVACRWTWLQAQVADLEFRIRQQADLCRQLRKAKGDVRLEGQDPPEDASTDDDDKAVTECDVQTTLSRRTCRTRPTPRGRHRRPSPTAWCSPPPNSDPPRPSAARGLGRWRRLPQAQGGGRRYGPRLCAQVGPLVGHSAVSVSLGVWTHVSRRHGRWLGLGPRRAAHLPPLAPCLVCGGRYNSVRPLDAELMTRQEKVALLDPGFHPVLSFPSGECRMPLVRAEAAALQQQPLLAPLANDAIIQF
ncbi:hypothetical protein HPB49_025802 [Dermacentor silvarum]|nr:hypothetical protein HPB49_025802 [Dermacentor silvarum]